MGINIITVSRSPITKRYTITKEDTEGHIRSTEVATFKQATKFIMMCEDDKESARRICEELAKDFENIIKEDQ